MLFRSVLSRDKARREESWTRLEKAFQDSGRVTGVIFGRVKGGFTVDLDGAVAFLGGVNVGAENLARYAGRRPIHDVHFRVEGPVTRVVMDAFARDWTFTTDELLDDDDWWPALEAEGTVFARGVRSGPDADLYKTELILGAALNLARKRIRIVTPYFLPESRLQFAIQEAGLRGVEVEIVLPGRSDQRLMDWAMRGQLRFFRHVKACFIVTPAPFDHSKLCTVDGEWSLVGSSNWDARSFRLNFEFDLEIIDRDLTSRIDALIDERLSRGGEEAAGQSAHDDDGVDHRQLGPARVQEFGQEEERAEGRQRRQRPERDAAPVTGVGHVAREQHRGDERSEEHTSELQSH